MNRVAHYKFNVYIKNKNRKGGAVVEAALCLPLILLIISATVELSTTIYLKESLTVACYEGARMAVTRNATDERVRDRIAEVLAERHIDMTGYTPKQVMDDPGLLTDILHP